MQFLRPCWSTRKSAFCSVAWRRIAGVFPGQWALPGGGVEPGERIEEALRREAREELGIELVAATPLLFKDAVLDKTLLIAVAPPRRRRMVLPPGGVASERGRRRWSPLSLC